MMELKILWMYHDLMDLYGDKGNAEVLRVRAQKRGIDVTLDTCTIGEKKDISDYDLFFMGGGADHEQGLIHEDLLSRRDNIQKAMDEKTAFLLICGAYQLFGQYYRDQDGHTIEGLHFFDYYTEATNRSNRCIGNIAIETTIDGETFPVVGFENHGGETKDVTTPFGKVLKGHGNTFEGGYEGFMNEHVIATYMHGPLLPKNPKIADAVLLRALHKRYPDAVLAPLDDTLEIKAQQVMLKRLNVL